MTCWLTTPSHYLNQCWLIIKKSWHDLFSFVNTKMINVIQRKKIRKIFTSPTYKYLSGFAVISDIYGSLIRNKTTSTKYCLTQWIWKLSRALKSLSKAVYGKFHGFGGQSKRNYLQDRANFHRSWIWQIVPIFNTGHIYQRVFVTCVETN